MLQLEKEVDTLMAQVKAGAPVADSKLLLHDIAVGARTFACCCSCADEVSSALSECCMTSPCVLATNKQWKICDSATFADFCSVCRQ